MSGKKHTAKSELSDDVSVGARSSSDEAGAEAGAVHDAVDPHSTAGQGSDQTVGRLAVLVGAARVRGADRSVGFAQSEDDEEEEHHCQEALHVGDLLEKNLNGTRSPG